MMTGFGAGGGTNSGSATTGTSLIDNDILLLFVITPENE